MNLEFKGIYKVSMDINVITGLHIGGSKETFEIGGIDNPVIKVVGDIDLSFIEDGWYIKEDMPYIPGSSLKGKMRSLLEWIENRVVDPKNEGKPCGCGNCVVCKIFGAHQNNNTQEPVKLKVEDAYPSKETIQRWQELGESIYTEIKTENFINRITAQAMPRPVERVPAGSVFKAGFSYEVYKDEDIDNFIKVFVALQALEDNFLGGGGSRGNGRVKFTNIKVSFKSKDYYINPASTNIKTENFKSVEEILGNFEKVKNLSK